MISAGLAVHQHALETCGLHPSRAEGVADGSRTDDGVCSGPGRAGFTTIHQRLPDFTRPRAKGEIAPDSEPCL
jgi:hypothetical protein